MKRDLLVAPRSAWRRALTDRSAKSARANKCRLNRSKVAPPEWLESRSLLAADLIISEFLADNTAGLKDQDNEFSDWIEIRNTTAAPISLANWSLTDSDNNLTKWQF